MTKYKALIGLEMHCEISETKTKVFSTAENSYNDIPNSNIRPVDMAFPGTLPVVNKEAVRKALMASLILNCKQPEYIYFERKNYYYPDLPKGFQITQETKPTPVGIYGKLSYECNDEIKTVRVNNIHLEEDAASSTHHEDTTTINYNRAGVPLLELVTEPDFHSADEAVAFLETMRSIYQYAGISEADSKKGQIRCDVNVSIMEEGLDAADPKNWGTKVEIKNVNSFGGVRDAINYEINRQIEAKEDGTYEKMEQQTRRFDEESGTTIYMRSKVDAIDYKYFVEPNIPKFKLDKSWLEEIKSSIPPLASERKEKYINDYNITPRDAKILVKEKPLADYFEETISLGANPQSVANWLNSIILGHINKMELSIKELFLTPKMLKGLIDLVEGNKISIKQAKEVLTKALEEEKDPVKLVSELGITQITDEKELTSIIDEVISENQPQLEAYKKNPKLFDYFVGQVMKKTRGKANPALTAKILKQELEKN
ncbi:MAG: Asp-tRNA(Asn)/Glu-tRNA(Gln) amidotransferase subunit GatB [Erysipelotrichaceae bacterium]|nr:Asp-tRNA(Asn)/Glu-tRNA(Gln) amidotransferase subunit GatB [Erysipelotrichaceae bacterium]